MKPETVSAEIVGVISWVKFQNKSLNKILRKIWEGTLEGIIEKKNTETTLGRLHERFLGQTSTSTQGGIPKHIFKEIF